LLLSRERVPAPDFVPCLIYWAVLDEQVAGRIALRLELNEFLRQVGGHIGYIVRPSFRGQGVATEMLRLVLATEAAKKMGRLLVTCDEGNLASEKAILRNGGVYERTAEWPIGKLRKRRFWIEVARREGEK
jgi:predicted acetyltransferase